MLYDRPYMKDEFEPRRFGALAWFATICAVIFVFQAFMPSYGLSGFIGEWFSLSIENIASFKIWTAASYAFLHGGPFHLLFNMAFIFFLGRVIQQQHGEKAALQILTLGILGGGALFLIINGLLGREVLQVVGASAGAMAIFCVACLLHYERQVELLLFFVLPVRVKVKWVFWALLGFDAFMLLVQEIPGNGRGVSMAHSAHIGGALAGILFFKYALAGNAPNPLSNLFDGLKSKKPQPKVEVIKTSRESRFNYRPKQQTVNLTNRNDVQKEVDRILDKINTQGFGSLNESEKATLERARDLLSK